MKRLYNPLLILVFADVLSLAIGLSIPIVFANNQSQVFTIDFTYHLTLAIAPDYNHLNALQCKKGGLYPKI